MGCFSSKEEEEEIDTKNWMVEIDQDYLFSSVSYYGLDEQIKNFSKAVRVVKGIPFLCGPKEKNSIYEESAKLYGLLHARYLCTIEGAEDMYEKYKEGIYGECPRYSCHKQHLIPMGLSNKLGEGKVKVFCPSCCDIYETDKDIDGAYFGPDFPMYFMKAMEFSPVPYKKENWIKTGDDKIDERLKRWPDNNQK